MMTIGKYVKMDGENYLLEIPMISQVNKLVKQQWFTIPDYPIYSASFDIFDSGKERMCFYKTIFHKRRNPQTTMIGKINGPVHGKDNEMTYQEPMQVYQNPTDPKGINDCGFLPILVPLDKKNRITKIDGENGQMVSGCTLYYEKQPIDLEKEESLRSTMFWTDLSMFIGDTTLGYELNWYIWDGLLVATRPVCRCNPDMLWNVGLGHPDHW